MVKDINEFFTFDVSKNGKVKVVSTDANKENIYACLHELGFRKSSLGKKQIYYQKVNHEIIPVPFSSIKHEFLSILRKADYTNIPSSISYVDVLNWYHSKRLIKQDQLFDNYLLETMTTDEIHSYRLKSEPFYRNAFEIQQLISQLNDWGFNKTTDLIGFYSKNNPLYYKKVATKKYLVFNHLNSNQTNGIFDSWLAIYGNDTQIGLKEPLECKQIRLGFQLDRDIELVQDFLN